MSLKISLKKKYLKGQTRGNLVKFFLLVGNPLKKGLIGHYGFQKLGQEVETELIYISTERLSTSTVPSVHRVSPNKDFVNFICIWNILKKYQKNVKKIFVKNFFFYGVFWLKLMFFDHIKDNFSWPSRSKNQFRI